MPYQQTTWATLRQRLQDKWEDVPFWTDAEALLAFNEGLRVWNTLTGWWKRRITVATTANTIRYTLPGTLVYRTRVEFNGQAMFNSSVPDLDNGRWRWMIEHTTSGNGVPTRPMLWAPLSLQKIVIWPADAGGGNTLTLDGVSATPVLVNTTDYLDIGEDTVTVLLGYALHAAALKKAGPYFAATQKFFRSFLMAAAEENDQLKTSQVYRRYLGLDVKDQRMRGTPTRLDERAGRAV
jgi:hypothetical protein